MKFVRFLCLRFLCLFFLRLGAEAGTVNYSYDAAGRLTKVDYGNNSVINYTYDAAGNLLSRQVAGAGPAISSVTTAYGSATISQNDFIVIKGSNLVPASTPSTGAIARGRCISNRNPYAVKAASFPTAFPRDRSPEHPSAPSLAHISTRAVPEPPP
jgi:YD repeat-containing protein